MRRGLPRCSNLAPFTAGRGEIAKTFASHLIVRDKQGGFRQRRGIQKWLQTHLPHNAPDLGAWRRVFHPRCMILSYFNNARFVLKLLFSQGFFHPFGPPPSPYKQSHLYPENPYLYPNNLIHTQLSSRFLPTPFERKDNKIKL